jgi:hypothetical protein
VKVPSGYVPRGVPERPGRRLVLLHERGAARSHRHRLPGSVELHRHGDCYEHRSHRQQWCCRVHLVCGRLLMSASAIVASDHFTYAAAPGSWGTRRSASRPAHAEPECWRLGTQNAPDDALLGCHVLRAERRTLDRYCCSEFRWRAGRRNHAAEIWRSRCDVARHIGQGGLTPIAAFQGRPGNSDDALGTRRDPDHRALRR